MHVLSQCINFVEKLTDYELKAREWVTAWVIAIFPDVHPNVITIVRFCLSIALFFPVAPALAVNIFILGVIGDFLDGVLARTRHQITFFGKLFDPIADRFLGLAAIFYLIQYQNVSALLLLVVAIPELIRYGTFLMVCIPRGDDVKPTILGRGANALYGISMLLLLRGTPMHTLWPFLTGGIVMSLLATIGYAIRNSSIIDRRQFLRTMIYKACIHCIALPGLIILGYACVLTAVLFTIWTGKISAGEVALYLTALWGACVWFLVLIVKPRVVKEFYRVFYMVDPKKTDRYRRKPVWYTWKGIFRIMEHELKDA